MPFVRNSSGGGKSLVVWILAAVVVIGSFFFARSQGWIKGKPEVAGVVGQGSSFENVGVVKVNHVNEIPLPSTEPATKDPAKPYPNLALMEWNAQIAEIAANGGPYTTKGSPMNRRGVQMHLAIQNDTEVAKTDFLKFVQNFKAGKTSPDDMHMFQIMGDGMPFHATTLTGEVQNAVSAVKKIDPSYEVVGVYTVGRSFNEDKVIGLKRYKLEPKTMAGAMAVDYAKDGDWNLRIDYQNKSGVCNNPNPETYMKECVNHIPAKDFLEAAQIFLANQPIQPRKVVDKDGKPLKDASGKQLTTKDLGLDLRPTLVSTWTPGDEQVIKGMAKNDPRYGKLAVLTSTKIGEQSGQMPCLVVGLKQWFDQPENSAWLDGFIDATNEAAMQVMSSPKWLDFAGEASAKVYNSHTGDYWVKYFKGFPFSIGSESYMLGGSMVHTVLDNALLFDLDENGNEKASLDGSHYGGVYRTFSRILLDNYKQEGYKVPDLNKVIDLSHLKRALARNKGGQSLIASVDFSQDAIGTVGAADYNIQFDLGKATIKPESLPLLNKLRDQALASDQKLNVYGHADAIGDENTNVRLSQARAEAVAAYIKKINPNAFPVERVNVKGWGSSRPLPGKDPSNCPECRRVEIGFLATR